jgi:cytochrome c oxidase subunit III
MEAPPMPTDTHLTVYFEDLEQQTHAARLGMWIVLGSEVLLFAGLFALYAAYRTEFPDTFRECVRHTSLWLGTAMTLVLISSSLLVALSVDAMRHGRAVAVWRYLVVSVLLGIVFLILKGTEYAGHFAEGIYPGAYYHDPELPSRAANIFFSLYYTMTALHALHVAVGMGLLAWVALRVRRRTLDAAYHTPLELSAMYWHLVDAIWIFLWPLFYLMH